MKLSTPQKQGDLAVISAEGWFLYWKTTPSLWKSKIENDHPFSKVYLPINWAFHCAHGNQIDFGQERPETDLSKLITIIRELGKEPVLLLPIGPCPLQTNGGLPSQLVNQPLLNRKGLAATVLDNEGRLTKLYSFYENKIYQSFCEYIVALNQYLVDEKINIAIWGISSGYIGQSSEFVSYFEDYSETFEKAYSRYLAKKDGADEMTPARNEVLRAEFAQTMNELYVTSAQEIFQSLWEGMFNVSFLGADQNMVFETLYDNTNPSLYSQQLFQALSLDVVTCSALLSPKQIGELLQKQIKDLSLNFLSNKVDKVLGYDESEVTTFRPLHFFNLYSDQGTVLDDRWRLLRIQEFINQQYSWCYEHLSLDKFDYDAVSARPEVIHVILGESLNDKNIHKVLRGLMNSGRIIIDSTIMDEEVKRKLEVFVLENNLKRERVKLHTLIDNIVLGDGRLILFDGSEIPEGKHAQFWERLFSTFNINHLDFDKDVGVKGIWQYRSPGPNELNYEEVRRVSLFNDTSYKHKVRVPFKTGFALMKIVDELNVKISSHENYLDLTFLPGSNVSLDFGVFQ